MRVFLIALTFIVLSVGNAWAQAGPCMPRDQMVAELKRDWNEAPAAWGAVPNGAIIELFIGPGNGRSFTIIITRPTGIACVLVGGHEWEERTLPPAGQPT